MEYDDVYVSDDGTRAIRWASVADHVTTGEYVCAKCALHGNNCMIDVLPGWSKMIEAVREGIRARDGWSPVCGDGMFVELDPLEVELHQVGGG